MAFHLLIEISPSSLPISCCVCGTSVTICGVYNNSRQDLVKDYVKDDVKDVIEDLVRGLEVLRVWLKT